MSNNPKRSGLPLKWNLESVNWFHEALLEHGKDFDKISFSMLKKSIRNNPQKIPNHLTSVGVRYFYYRNLRKASNLLHAYECRHPTAPGLAGVALKKSGQSTFNGNTASPKRINSTETESNKSDMVTTVVANENKDYPDSTNSPSNYTTQEQANEISTGKRGEDPSNELNLQVPTNTNTTLTQQESEESILTDVDNPTTNHVTKELYEKNCQSKSITKEQIETTSNLKNIEKRKNENTIEEPSKRDLTKEWVQIEGLGRCSLDLIAVICYTKLHIILGEKINYRNKLLTHRITSYLGELVYKGATKYRNRGHIKRIKLPNCKVLKTPTFTVDKLKLQNDPAALDTHASGNNSDSSGDERPTSTTNIAVLHKPKRSKLRVGKNLFNVRKTVSHSTQTDISCIREQRFTKNHNICIEFVPRDDLTYKIVQSIAQNPHLRIFASPNTFFANITTLLNTKWKKLFARSADLTIDFDFEFSDTQMADMPSPSNQFLTHNFTVKELLISQINTLPKPIEVEASILRLRYHFCTNYEHVLIDGIDSQISPLSALVQLLNTINKCDRKGSRIPIGKNFPRKFTTDDRREDAKNLITRSLLKNKLEKLRQIHASKSPLNRSKIAKIEQLKKLSNRPNSSALKCLIEYLRNHNDQLKKISKNTADTQTKFSHKPLPKSKCVKSSFTRSVPSSFHSVLKEKATSRSLFSSEVEDQINAHANPELSPRNDMQRLIDELGPVNDEFYYGDPNKSEYLPDFSGGDNQINTFSMLADAYFGVDGVSDLQQGNSSLPENFVSACPSVVSENFQSLLCELDGMVNEWETDEVCNNNTEPALNHTDLIPNPAKMFLQYFLNSHDSDSDDRVMRSIFEDDSLDGLSSQHMPYNNNSQNIVEDGNRM
ncbi:hypothetical protein LOD99_6645 [Oopsacas minuta]|uniref:Uncharacterized protein n=1 Tax=Oopsacas minuta TaxID=111878 RepID=A0AAV7JLK4_9METZ|nr:hypothetical protein LOD99_6645 [Oopsacas minuta]